jgi:endonuclease YncB( thermonuclease family)
MYFCCCFPRKTKAVRMSSPLDKDWVRQRAPIKFEFPSSSDKIAKSFYVSSVYDGDTITAIVPMNWQIYSFDSDYPITGNIYDGANGFDDEETKVQPYEIKIRLYGIDTPEMKPLKTMVDREDHIRRAKLARLFLASKVEEKMVRMQFHGHEKFGRVLATLFDDDNQNINQMMVDEGYALPYFGGKKTIS